MKKVGAQLFATQTPEFKIATLETLSAAGSKTVMLYLQFIL